MPRLLQPVTGCPKISHTFWCPACQCGHYIGEGWTWDGNEVAPTVTPSILVNRGQANPMEPVCHFFIRGGQLVYLHDCTHTFAGQSVAMVSWDDVDELPYDSPGPLALPTPE